MRVRFEMDNGMATDITVGKEGLIELYRKMKMNTMFILTEADGTFSAALNPRHIVRIVSLP